MQTICLKIISKNEESLEKKLPLYKKEITKNIITSLRNKNSY
jgi:hypothetical protein